MSKFLLSLIIFFCSFNVFASKCNHHDHQEVRYINNKQPLNPVLQEALRKQDLWQRFIQNHSDWFVIFNENNYLPHRAFGSPIPLSNGVTTEDKVLNFLNTNNFSLPADLRFNGISKNNKHINIDFKQYYNSLEIIDSRLYAKLSLNEELIMFGLDVFNDINISINPTISEQQAIYEAKDGIHFPIQNISIEDDLKILPIPVNEKYEYHLIYIIHIDTRIEEGPANYICYIDANSGELLMRNNKVLYEAPPNANISVTGDVYTTNSFNPSTTEKFVDLRVRHNNTDYYTNNAGSVNIPSNSGNATFYLDGLFAEVQTNNVVASFNSSLSNTSVDFNNDATIQERTAFYSVNKIHTHMKSVFPNFTLLDNPMETNIDESGSCNAYYNGSSINFYEEGGGCNATAKIPDVVYHEYGHAINGWNYGSTGMQNGGQNEGYADIWALSLTLNPVLGFGWDLIDPTIFVRRYDQNRKVYPQDLVGQVHADGEIIAGCFWDTYLNLGNMTQMLDLFKYTFDPVGAPQASNGDEGVLYTDILIEVLFADDNDNNLSNGTPNDIDIVSAFALHGITLLSNAIVNHNEVTSSVGNVDISISANITNLYPWNPLSSANCFYRLNNSTSWIDLPMNLTGPVSNQTAQIDIPAQSDGNIIAYYISITDIYGYQSGIKPMAANLTPLNNANLPYYILVGYNLISTEDFDFSSGFWQTGDPADLATTGMWEIGPPTASYDDPQQFTGIVQTGSQHTPGGFSCAFTQNASSAFAGIGDSDVDDGHTTLYSPFYDLSTYINPAFSYYRWYTNSPPSGANPNADWWQVLISDDGVTWHYVENNKNGEINWRKHAFRAKDYISLTNSVQLKFIASDSLRPGQNLDGGSLVEAAVDDLVLYDAQNSPTDINNVYSTKPKLIKIVDLLGRNIDVNKLDYNIDNVLLYIYDNGLVKKKIIHKSTF